MVKFFCSLRQPSGGGLGNFGFIQLVGAEFHVQTTSVTETGAQSQKLLGSYAFFVAKRQLRKTTSASNSASPISEMAFFSNKLIRRSSPLTGTTSE